MKIEQIAQQIKMSAMCVIEDSMIPEIGVQF